MSTSTPTTTTSPTPPAVPDTPVTVDPMHVVVVLPEHQQAQDGTVRSALTAHTRAGYLPFRLYPVREATTWWGRKHRTPVCWNLVHRTGGVPVTAGGPRGHLDLQALTGFAGWQAQQRWQAWKTYVAERTPRARDWQSFAAGEAGDRRRPGRDVPWQELRRRFEAQPRVLAMLAVNAQLTLPFLLDPDELAAFQAGEVVYCTLAAQQAVVGQMLVVPGGVAYRPVTESIADRLRYLHIAAGIVRDLHPDQQLAAVIRASAG
jgi:hypothetical protein